MKETVSIIIPTFQHRASLEDCLHGVFSQTDPADEVIVVDDGSTDGTKELLQPYQDRLTYIYQDNAGAPVARMRGFNASSGSLLLFCDADVRMRGNMLEELKKALRSNPMASWAYSGFRWGWKRFPSRSYDSKALREHNYIHTTSLIRRKHFPGFDPSLKRFQDWDLWLTMSEQGYQGVFIDQVLFHVVHQHGRVGMSAWVPSFLFKLPWKGRRVRAYEQAKEIIQQKHRL
jgi:glycosyltransferase involved in cell wall biosynthesis